MELPDEEVCKYFDEEYFISKFALGRNISITMPSESEESSQGMVEEFQFDDADEQNFKQSNFVDEIVESCKCIARLEERIEHKSKTLMNLELAIKVLFTENMILQKQILLSHDYKCDYMIEDLQSLARLLEKLDKPVGKSKAEAEAALWTKESEKTYELMNKLKEYLGKTIKEVFSNNYENVCKVPLFTILVSDNTSILHRQFFDHFSDLYVRGKVHEDCIKSLHNSISQTQSNVQLKFRQLSEIASNMFYNHNATYENRLTYEYNSDIEDEVENYYSGEESIVINNNNNENNQN